mgnify:CR=1 FL=1
MAVNERDPLWAKDQEDREKVLDLIAGRRKAVDYIRTMPGWDSATLTSIKAGAYFLPMVGRTAEAFGGLVFSKAPMREVPAGLEPYLDDVTQAGQEIDRFAEQALDAVMATGSVMVLVDYPASDANVTRAQAEAMGLRPVLKLYDATCVLAARMTLVGAVRKLTHVRVAEVVEEEAPTTEDPFALDQIEQVRVLELIDGAYQQSVWRMKDGRWKIHETITPRMGGAPLDEIPAFFCNTRDGEPNPARPPLTDIADVNIAHLQNAAQHEWGLAWLGAPVLFGAGFALPEGETIQMGSSSAIVVEDASAKLEIVQADANAFSGIKTAMDDKRRDAGALGARMLLEESKQAVAAETARIQRAGELSVVGAMANAVSQCLTNALAFMAKWAGVGGQVQYWLNTDLLGSRMDAQTLASLLSAWQSGAISKRSLFAKLQEGEIVDPASTFEDEQEEIANEGMASGLVTGAP